MNLLAIRDKLVNALILMADFDKIKLIYYITITIYIAMRMFFKKNISPYDLIVVFPGLYLAGYMLKYADESARKYGPFSYLFLYIGYYFLIILFLTGSIIILIDCI